MVTVPRDAGPDLHDFIVFAFDFSACGHSKTVQRRFDVTGLSRSSIYSMQTTRKNYSVPLDMIVKILQPV